MYVTLDITEVLINPKGPVLIKKIRMKIIWEYTALIWARVSLTNFVQNHCTFFIQQTLYRWRMRQIGPSRETKGSDRRSAVTFTFHKEILVKVRYCGNKWQFYQAKLLTLRPENFNSHKKFYKSLYIHLCSNIYISQ